jgi:hypothetical protein
VAAEQLTEQVLEEVAEGLEGAASHFEEAATITRRIDARGVGFILGGLGAGLAIGFYIGYRINREKIRAEAFATSEAEVEKIRELYREQADSVRIAKEKPTLEEVVEERGYHVEEIDVRPTRPPVPVREPSEHHFSQHHLAKRTEDGEKDKNEGWNYPEELAQRSPQQPYIVHQDEFFMNEDEYEKATLTYYAGDDVLTDEDELPVDAPDAMVGLDNLKRFGHGTDDLNVLFVRNDVVRMMYEICRTELTFIPATEQEHLGHDNGEPD